MQEEHVSSFFIKKTFFREKNDLLGSIRVHYSFFLKAGKCKVCISREYISDKNVKLITTKKYIWRTNRACKKEWLIIQAAEKSNIIHSKMCIYTTYFYNLKDFHLWNIEIIIIKSNFFFSLRRGSGGCNSRDASGYTALHYSSLNGHL